MIAVPEGHCKACADPGPQSSNKPKGREVKFSLEEGFTVDGYEVGSGSKYIVLCTDVFGYSAPNCQRNADDLAAAGFHVVAPDYFKNDPLPMDVYEKGGFPEWAARHSMEYSQAVIKAVIDQLGAKTGVSIGLLGYCWGAPPVVASLSRDVPSIKCGVVAHPSRLHECDPTRIIKPLHACRAEHDEAFSAEAAERWRNGVGAHLWTETFHPGTRHGFAARPQLHEEKERDLAMEATIAQFKRHL